MSYQLIQGNCLDVLRTLDAGSVQCCVTSPPYFGLRDYGVDSQLGNEATPAAYVENMVNVFREVWRVLAADGVLWLNLGDSYSTGRQGELPAKNLFGIPWLVAFALQVDGWILRSDIIWHKPNPMPESVTDRPTRAHEYLFMLVKQGKYYYDGNAIKEPASYPDDDRKGRAKEDHKSMPTAQRNGTRPRTDKQRGHVRRHGGFNERWDGMTKEEQCSGMRNKRDVWTVAPSQFAEAHFATFPPALIEPCILASSRPGDIVLDPFSGSGTAVAVALQHDRRAIGIELNPVYIEIAHQRISRTPIMLPMGVIE